MIETKPTYIHHHNVYGDGTRQSGDLSWWPSTHNSQNILNIWACKITWQTKNILFPITHCRCFCPFSYMTFLWITWFCTSSEILKTFYFYYHSTYGQKIWQGGDIQYGASTYKVTWSFNHEVLWGHISTCTTPMVTKHGKALSFVRSLFP